MLRFIIVIPIIPCSASATEKANFSGFAHVITKARHYLAGRDLAGGQNSAKKPHPNDVVALSIIIYSDICMKI
jgi:hypothetical protein